MKVGAALLIGAGALLCFSFYLASRASLGDTAEVPANCRVIGRTFPYYVDLANGAQLLVPGRVGYVCGPDGQEVWR